VAAPDVRRMQDEGAPFLRGIGTAAVQRKRRRLVQNGDVKSPLRSKKEPG
jgi:hypothetical protein